MRDSIMVMDLQFGSTGKGLLVGKLAQMCRPDTAIAAWGPNAGHTFIDEHGSTYIHTMLPIAAVCDSVRTVLLGPGSIINWDALLKETQAMMVTQDRVRKFKIIVHPQAMMVYPRHLHTERANVKIGSTMKGTGAALVEKIQRDPDVSPLVRDCDPTRMLEHVQRFDALGIELFIDEDLYNEAVDRSTMAMIEGAQGFSLGINRQFWPYTTSRDITPAQILVDCALPINYDMVVYGTLRTFPIRVANRFDENGVQIGTSGPFYDDQQEITWEALGLEPELTTVTKLKRRVFTFSDQQLTDAVRLCRPHFLFANFLNYLNPDEVDEFCDRVDGVCARVIEAAPPTVRWLGFGPTVNDVKLRAGAKWAP